MTAIGVNWMYTMSVRKRRVVRKKKGAYMTIEGHMGCDVRAETNMANEAGWFTIVTTA